MLLSCAIFSSIFKTQKFDINSTHVTAQCCTREVHNIAQLLMSVLHNLLTYLAVSIVNHSRAVFAPNTQKDDKYYKNIFQQ